MDGLTRTEIEPAPNRAELLGMAKATLKPSLLQLFSTIWRCKRSEGEGMTKEIGL